MWWFSEVSELSFRGRFDLTLGNMNKKMYPHYTVQHSAVFIKVNKRKTNIKLPFLYSPKNLEYSYNFPYMVIYLNLIFHILTEDLLEFHIGSGILQQDIIITFEEGKKEIETSSHCVPSKFIKVIFFQSIQVYFPQYFVYFIIFQLSNINLA